MITGIYKIEFKTTNWWYIGSSYDVKKRVETHKKNLKKGVHCNTVFQHLYDTYSEENLTYEILEECDEKALEKKEKYWYLEYNKLYESTMINMRFPFRTDFTEETRKKLSDINKGKHHSEETKRKLSELSVGNKNHFFGKHHSEETKRKMSESSKGIVTWNKGKKHSEETKRKISDTLKKKYREQYEKRSIKE